MDAEKNYQRGGELVQGVSKTMADVLQALEEYVAHSAKYRIYKQLNDALSKSEGVIYKCAGGVEKELEKRLMAENRPCYVVNNQLILQKDDLNRAFELNKQILIEKTRYIQSVDLETMKKAIFKSDMDERNVFVITGLNKYEQEVIKNKCSNLKKGFLVGVGEGCIGVHERDVFDETDGSRDFCAAFLKANVSLYGPNMSQKMRELDYDITFQKDLNLIYKEETRERSSLFVRDGDPNKFIVGKAADNNYIELSTKGFEYYEIRGGKSISVESVDIDDPMYAEKLQRYTDKMSDKQVMGEAEKNEHYLHPHSHSPKRAQRDRYIEERSRFEECMTEKINDMIEKRIQEEQLKGTLSLNTPKEKFEYYTREARKILFAVSNDSVAEGYKKEDFEEIKNAAKYQEIGRDIGSRRPELKEHTFDLSEYERAAQNMTAYKTRTIGPKTKEKNIEDKEKTTDGSERDRS